MPQPQLEQRVSTIEETFQAFLEAQTELNRKADERNRKAEERNRKAEERNRKAEERNRKAEERNRKAEERFERLEKRLDQIAQEQLELNQKAEERNQKADERNRKAEERWQKSWDESWAKFDKEANRIRGELAKKMGTIAEDLVAPSVPEILRQIAGCEPGDVELVGVRMRQRHPQDRSKQREIDVLAMTQDLALVVEVRSKLRPPDIPEAVARFQSVREFFGKTIEDRKILGAVASLYPDPSIVTHAERQGLIVLGLGRDLMDVKNSKTFEPKHF